MKKLLPLICLLFCTAFGNLYGQPTGSPCCTGENIPEGCTEAGTSQSNACIICSLAGIYQGNNGGYPASGGFSCGVPHNSAWVAVIANSAGAIDATVLASNCVTGDGLQLILWDAAGNELACYSVPGSTIPATVSASGLTPGALYTFQIDGFSGDVCDFTIVVNGAETGTIPDPVAEIRMDPDTTLCPGATVCFEIDAPANANEYEWVAPPNMRIISGGGPFDLFMCCLVETAGGGALSVTPSNFCFNGFPTILPVLALPIPPSFWDPLFVCNNDMPFDTILRGKTYFFDTYGAHQITFVTALGCDSVVNVNLIPLLQVPHIIDTTICEGDCVMVGPDCYDMVGSVDIALSGPNYQQQNGCDSIVKLILRKLNPVAEIADPDDLPCMPGATVALDGTNSSSGAAFTYQWTASNGGTFASATNTNVAAASSPGTYILAVTETSMDGNIQCVALDTVMVEQEVQVLNDPMFTPPVATSACLGETYTYTIGAVSGAINYDWTVPTGATLVGAGTSVMVTFDSGTGGQLCVKAIGTCGESMNVCIPVTVNPIPTSTFTVGPPICVSESATIQYTGSGSPFATYTWNFNGGDPATVSGPGPHSITWAGAGTKNVTLTVEEAGCTSSQTTEEVQVDPELAAPVISCDPTQTSVEFSWASVPNASDYTVTINSGSPTTQSGTSILVDQLNPGDVVDITVVANSTNACPSTMTTEQCTAQNCPMVTIDIPQVAAICRDASTSSMMLTATQTGGLGGGSFTWSGPGVSANGSFDPSAANVGDNVISVQYNEGTCSYTGSTTISVNDVPDPSFTVVSPLCVTESSTITYTGSASAAGNYTWDFGSGTVDSGSDAGPYEISWPAGSHTVSLVVTENGCTSPSSSESVTMDAELTAPIITCGTPTTTSVSFSWTDVPGATGYTVNGPSGADIDLNARTVEVTGLGQNDMITIEVVAESGGECPSVSATATCETSDCVVETITPTAIGPFCDDGTGSAVMLEAVTSAPGTLEWSGPGVSGDMFDPNSPAVNPGILTLTARLTIANCEYTQTMDVTIFGQPTSDFTVTGPVCEGEEAVITYDGNADVTTATFDWDFAAGTPATANVVGPHNVSWTDEGDKDVTLTVTDNNCVSAPTMATIQVDEPLVPSTWGHNAWTWNGIISGVG